MAQYQIAYNSTTKTATVQPLNDALPEDSINIGQFEHAGESDPLGPDFNHVLFHHVREALYKRSAANPSNTAMFPDNITDLQNIIIVNDTTANPMPINSVAPAITGTLEVGDVLTTTNGTWSDASTYARQWKSSSDGNAPWANITGETGATYTLLVGDVGKFIRCDVTATNANGSNTAMSNVVGPVI